MNSKINNVEAQNLKEDLLLMEEDKGNYAEEYKHEYLNDDFSSLSKKNNNNNELPSKSEFIIPEKELSSTSKFIPFS